MNSIFNYTLNEIEEILENNNFKRFHGKQIFKWLYDKRVNSFDEMSDLSIKLRNFLKENYFLNHLKLKHKQVSKDQTEKFLFELDDNQYIESVLMLFDYGYSACITTQLGCNMGCKFCASGLLKKIRNLEVNEIVLQVLMIQKYLDTLGKRLSNIVVMGIGEPFDNFDNVFKALEIINCVYGLEIGQRHISVSTCGLVPGIIKFADLNMQYNLAISLHAPNDEIRSKIMPINKSFNLKALFEAIDYYISKSNRRITFEYILLKGINDSKTCAKELALLLKGKNAYINLIPYNSVEENEFISSSSKDALTFYDYLKKEGVAVTLRQKKGDDIDAACGQLRAKWQK